MKTLRAFNYYRKLLRNVQTRRYCSAEERKEKVKNNKIRNIGILAHIDAGKTTTTERMLFYSGTIRSMGEVHHGNTVTDYMEQERQRGITITSAAVSFPWQGYQINLIDTPGHIDFTMEVEQSLAVLDGAVVVLDGSAGVEAQTLTVWRQADNYKVPRILYLNKMDRSDADVSACVRSIEDKLQVTPLMLHWPVQHEGKLIGLIDLVSLEEIIWTQGRGQNFVRRKLTEKSDGKVWETSLNQHRKVIDTLSSVDDELAEMIIQEESLDNLDIKDIARAIRRSTIAMKAFPVLCGSSYKNIGVQTLMDSVVSYLPSPFDGNVIYKSFDTDLSARVFKVQHDDQRGVLTFLRLYSGEINKGQKIYNLARDQSEQTGLLYVALADEYQTVEKVTAGNIAVVSALKATMSGDLITSTNAAANRAKERLVSMLKDPSVKEDLILPNARLRLQAMDADPTPAEVAEVLLGIGNTVPEPVFLCSIEPPSAALQPALEAALAELAREDPSLRVTADDDTGQIVLAGMGELHLEIIKERIIREYKIDAELGPPQISYKETLVGTAQETLVVDRKIGNAKQQVKVTMSARHLKGVTADKVLKFDKCPESAANLSHAHPRHLQAVRRGLAAALLRGPRLACPSAANLSHAHPRHLQAVRRGLAAALLRGPRLACPLVDVQVTLHWLEVSRGSADSTVAAAVAQCLRKVFSQAESVLLEPLMSLELVVPESHSARLLADLARRRADVQDIHLRHGTKVIRCLAPLSELLGYSTTVRSLSSGLATFSMEFHCNRQMSPRDEEKAIRSVTGF